MPFTLPYNVVLIFAPIGDMIEFAMDAQEGSGCMFSSDITVLDEQERQIARAHDQLESAGFASKKNIEDGKVSLFHSWRNLSFDGAGVVNDGPTMLRISIEQNAQRVFPQRLYFFTDSQRVVQEVGQEFIKFPRIRLIHQISRHQEQLKSLGPNTTIQMGNLGSALNTVAESNFASVIFLTRNKEDSTVLFKDRVDSACHAQGIQPKDLHHSMTRHQVWFRAVCKEPETSIDEMVDLVSEMFQTTGYKTQILYTDIRELYEKLTERNKPQG